MPRVVGVDPGTVSVDLCGLDGGRVFLDESRPTAAALADPAAFVGRLEALEADGALDLVAGPSGYGLPLVPARDARDDDLRLALLGAAGEPGGIGGLGRLMRALARSRLPVVFTPGVVHLASVPAYRKVNRVDLGTADKVCAAALAIHEQARRRGCAPREVSCILLELGGAFTAAVAVEAGRVVDGVGGTSGPIGLRAAGALDGEVAFLAGHVSKATLFGGGAAAVAGMPNADTESVAGVVAGPRTPGERTAREAYLEGAVKAVAALSVAAPAPHEVILSGRMAAVDGVREELAARLARVVRGAGGEPVPVCVLEGFARVAKQGAQGAALIADGLAGGASAPLVEAMGLRASSGTVLDHLYVVPPAEARRRLGIA